MLAASCESLEVALNLFVHVSYNHLPLTQREPGCSVVVFVVEPIAFLQASELLRQQTGHGVAELIKFTCLWPSLRQHLPELLYAVVHSSIPGRDRYLEAYMISMPKRVLNVPSTLS